MEWDTTGYWAAECPDKEAVWDDGRRFTYADLEVSSRKLAAAFRAAGIAKGDRVATFLPNVCEFVMVMYASINCGAGLVPANFNADEATLDYIVTSTEPKVVCVHKQEQVLWLRKGGYKGLIVSLGFENAECRSFDSLLEAQYEDKGDAVDHDPDDLFAIVHTSGTTGLPKGVVMTFESAEAFIESCAERLGCGFDDVSFNPLPNCHLFGFFIGLLIPLSRGGRTVLIQRFSPTGALDLARDEGITLFHGVPAMFAKILGIIDSQDADLTRVRTGIVAGAGCPRSIISGVKEKMGFPILNAYGSTEGGIMAMVDPLDPVEIRENSVGKPVSGISIKMIDEDGAEVERGKVGELISKGPGVMPGYWRSEERTRKVIDSEGWLHTGDLAYYDEEGFIRIQGRKSDVIMRGAENIYPIEIEKAYKDHPGFEEFCIVGAPDDVLGEVIAAYAVVREGYEMTLDDVRAFGCGKLAKYKLPDRFTVLSEMPRTPVGKPDYKALRAMASN